MKASPSKKKSVRKKHTNKSLKEDGRSLTGRSVSSVSCAFAENHYSGTLRQDTLGARFLEGPCETYQWASGLKYEGPFVGSQVEGKGKFSWPDGSHYEGEISNGKRHGHGVYVAADGVTRYEGQWHEGKRHGCGKLTYDATGDSFYEGQWEEGAKHGEGRQVWPSKNVYQGQWKLGRMSGQGTMMWYDGDMVEQYRGHWEDDHPEGEGTHTWYVNESPLDQGSKEMPSQQMNNRYEGQWHDGVRHGHGTFGYANGARYTGNWEKNVKQGDGRYTFEDGHVYSGSFAQDQMTANADQVPVSASGRPLNIGNEDNPVRRCIDISDLEPYALPVDVGPQNFDIGSGYDEEHEVMREVHNMLLRYLGELKQSYSRYRGAVPRPGADPFVLSVHQFWIFCRDAGIVTPSCSLSQLNRSIRAGPRHHQEAAYEDLEELRPLTPTSPGDHFRRRQTATSDHLDTSQMESEAAAALAEASQQEASEEGDEREVDESSVGSSTEGSQGTTEDADEAAAAEDAGEEGTGEIMMGKRSSVQSRGNSPGRVRPLPSVKPVLKPIVYPLHSKFWREEGGAGLVDVHEHSGMLIFRHFLESIVRMSLSRYPHEKGLEHQLRRLFKESILPSSLSTESCAAFAFLVDAGVQEALAEFQPQLWRLFKENAAGEGAYDRPHWISLVEVEPKPPEEAGAAEAEAQEEAEPGPSSRALPPLESRQTRRGFGGQQRRVHLRAHLDVTVRVKDVLKLFSTAGLLKPLSECEEAPQARGTLTYESLFAPPASEGCAESPDMERIEGLQGLEAMLIKNASADGIVAEQSLPRADTVRALESGTPNLMGTLKKQIMATRTLTSDAVKGALGPVASSSLGVTDESFGHQHSDEIPGIEEDKVMEAEEHWSSAADHTEEADLECILPSVLQEQCNLRISFFELLRIALEVCLPEATSKLFWALKGEEDAVKEECVAVLDYLETELCFAEFQRVIVRFAERQTEQISQISSLPICKRLEGFMRHVFLPSLRTPYRPPELERAASAEGEDLAAASEASLQVHENPDPSPPQLSPVPPPMPPSSRKNSKLRPVPKGKAQAAPPARSEDPTPEAPVTPVPQTPPPPRPLAFWGGFDDDEALDMGGVATPRCWPAEYADEVLEW